MALSDKVALTQDIIAEIRNVTTATDLDRIYNIIAQQLHHYNIERIPGDEAVNFDFLEAFIEAKTVEGKSEKTLKLYRYIITRFINEVGVPAEKVSIYDVRSYMTKLADRGLADKSRQNIRNIISAFFNWLSGEGLIEKSPCANLGVVKCQKKLKLPFSPTDIDIMRQAVESSRDRAIIDVLLSTGCRISELTGLSKSDIDFAKGECRVLGKGNKYRITFLSEVAVMTLHKYLGERTDTSDALFVGRGSSRLTDSAIRKIFDHLSEKTGIDNIHPHRFRHTLATNLINRGMTIQEVAIVLGHDNVNTTMEYIYIDNKRVKSSYEKYSA